MGERGLDALRQDDRDPIAARDAEHGEAGGKAAGARRKLSKARLDGRGILAPVLDQGDASRVDRRPVVGASGGDVELCREIPCKIGDDRRIRRQGAAFTPQMVAAPVEACGDVGHIVHDDHLSTCSIGRAAKFEKSLSDWSSDTAGRMN